MTDCFNWRSDQNGTIIEEKHGPAEVPAGDVWPNDVTLDLTNIARWTFEDYHLNNYPHSSAEYPLAYEVDLEQSSSSTSFHPGALTVTFSRKIASSYDEMEQLVGK